MFLLRFRLIRYLITITRLIYFTKIRRKKILKQTSSYNKRGTLERNIKSALSFRDCYSGQRSSFFLNKFKQLCKKYNRNKLNILLVGPRNEGEIFNFLANDFKFKLIDAIDLFSYSPKIQVKDMHKINKIKKKYDLIYFGFILNYSNNINSVIKKSSKILKNNGMIGVSLESDNWPKLSKKLKKIYVNRLKKQKFEKLVRIKKRHIYNQQISKIFDKIFYFSYVEQLGFKFQDKKCMTILLKKRRK